jgi:hypothetical protein
MSRCRASLLAFVALSLALPALSADWVVDRCRFTYKGTPVPLGTGLAEFVKLFGPPSDSFIKPIPGQSTIKTYYWDRIGLGTRYYSDAHADLFGGVEISFREPVHNKAMRKRRFPRGTSSLEFRPFGLLDSNTIWKVVREGFKPGHAPGAPESEYLDLDLGSNRSLTLLPLKDDQGKHYGLSIRYAGPDEGEFRNYAILQSRMNANCLISGK